MASTHLSPTVLQQDRSTTLYAVTITGYSIAVLAVALRLIMRRLTKVRFWWDDLFIVFALVGFFQPRSRLYYRTNDVQFFGTGILIVKLIQLSVGLGRHIQVATEMRPDASTIILKALFAGDFMYTFSIVFSKMVKSLAFMAP